MGYSFLERGGKPIIPEQGYTGDEEWTPSSPLEVNITKEYTIYTKGIVTVEYRVEIEFSCLIHDLESGTGQDFTKMDELIKDAGNQTIKPPAAEYLALWLWDRIKYMKVAIQKGSFDEFKLQRITVEDPDTVSNQGNCNVTIRDRPRPIGGYIRYCRLS
mgnify:CR=1 FL=1